MPEPKLPDGFDGLSQDEQIWEKKLLRHRLVHYHYILSTWVTTGSTTRVWSIRSVISVVASATMQPLRGRVQWAL